MDASRRTLLLLAWCSAVALSASGCFDDPAKVEPPDATLAPAASAAELIKHIETAYRTRDAGLFESLLAQEPAARAEFVFLTQPDRNTGLVEEWGASQELSIHQRMFEPEATQSGPNPVPVEFWLKQVTATIVAVTQFSEQGDLYESPQNPNGLSPLRWKAMRASYSADVFFDLNGADYAIDSLQEFVVIQDLDKVPGSAGAFLLLRWQDLDWPSRAAGVAVVGGSWSEFKTLYR